MKFIGELAIDHGGLFRESMTEMSSELHSHMLDLFVPTPNNRNNLGEDRHKYTLNPTASS